MKKLLPVFVDDVTAADAAADDSDGGVRADWNCGMTRKHCNTLFK